MGSLRQHFLKNWQALFSGHLPTPLWNESQLVGSGLEHRLGGGPSWVLLAV